jgi:hypothetical protein
MASSIRDLDALLEVLGITEEGLADVTENDLDVAFQQKAISELEERRRVRSAWKRQQQRSGILSNSFLCDCLVHICFSFC